MCGGVNPPFSLSGTRMVIPRIPVSPGGEDVHSKGLRGFTPKCEFVPLSKHSEVVPEPHHPCNVADAGVANTVSETAAPRANAENTRLISVSPFSPVRQLRCHTSDIKEIASVDSQSISRERLAVNNSDAVNV